MNHPEYAKKVLDMLLEPPVSLPIIAMDEGRRRNAGRCMTLLACNRLAKNGQATTLLQHTTFEWNDGLVALRNSRVADHFWSNVTKSAVQRVHEFGHKQPVAYLLNHWDTENGILHTWAIPEDVAFDAFSRLLAKSKNETGSVEIGLEDHQLKQAADAPNFGKYYAQSKLTETEIPKLAEAIKTDDNIKLERLASSESDGADPTNDQATDDSLDEPPLVYNEQTVKYVEELASHTGDGEWHEKNKKRYEQVLRDPSQYIVDELRTRYIQKLSATVAGGKRHLSILKKNDYGKGGYHDHYWFAFYDPAAGSKTKSVQLYLRLLSAENVWRYGFSFGNYCDPYIKRFLSAITSSKTAVAKYFDSAPSGTVVRVLVDGSEFDENADAFASRIQNSTDAKLGLNAEPTNVDVIREYPLSQLPSHTDGLIEEVGEFFEWVWPFFEASMTGIWNTPTLQILVPGIEIEEPGEVDETAPQTLQELSELTALSKEFLEELEDALIAKQQAVLVGPPGTSKTYIARQFSRYFARQRKGQPQGKCDVLYMHANWTYEDFFEGIKPTTKDGALTFESRMGYFLEWVTKLNEYSPDARHVLVLDEINRCDTASVLGELLQLLEYRGTTVRLLSGRDFVFPNNLFIIGTMNSADRSIGRLDLALRRRFLWLDLHPQPGTLDRWLKRTGNNPLGFKADQLAKCNELLSNHGIPPEQQIGHALFMLQRVATDDEASLKRDFPLSAKQLRQIVRFSVLPYIRELITLQHGQSDESLLKQIADLLLSCINESPNASTGDGIDATPSP